MDVLKGIVNRAKKRNSAVRKKCYEEHGNKDGTCYGLVGGDRYTEYVQYGCISCRYWRYYEGGGAIIMKLIRKLIDWFEDLLWTQAIKDVFENPEYYMEYYMKED